MALGTVPAQGQELGRLWTFTPEMGQGPAFEAALRSHMEFRKAQGDPWDWQIYQVVVGDDVGDFYLLPGKQASFNEALMKFDEAITGADMPFYYTSDVPVVGGSGPVFFCRRLYLQPFHFLHRLN